MSSDTSSRPNLLKRLNQFKAKRITILIRLISRLQHTLLQANGSIVIATVEVALTQIHIVLLALIHIDQSHYGNSRPARLIRYEGLQMPSKCARQRFPALRKYRRVRDTNSAIKRPEAIVTTVLRAQMVMIPRHSYTPHLLSDHVAGLSYQLTIRRGRTITDFF